MRETIFRGMARSSLVAVLLAWALVFSNLVPATADEAVDMPLTPVSGVAHYDADYRVPVVESQLGIGAPLSDDPASLVTLTGIEAGHDGALVRVSVFNVDEPLTVFAAGAPALAVEEGAASTMVLVPVDDGEVSLYGTASADLRVELLASFAGDPEVPGSTIALAEPVTRADTAAVLADNSLQLASHIRGRGRLGRSALDGRSRRVSDRRGRGSRSHHPVDWGPGRACSCGTDGGHHRCLA